MELADLSNITTNSLQPGHTLHRIQRTAVTEFSVVRGPLNLAAAGMLSNRFDLPGAPCAYLSETPETALYETFFRRECTGASISAMRRAELLTVQVTAELDLADIRPYTTTWPVLQSMRSSLTQALAIQIYQAGFAGAIYRSAQHFGRDCIVLFDPSSDAIREITRVALVNQQGAVLRLVADAVRHSGVLLTP